MVQQARRHWWTALILSVAVGACVTLGVMKSRHVDRGLAFVHAKHPAKDLACTDCHATDNGDPALPNHDVCEVCHDERMAKKDASQEQKVRAEACGYCHTRPDQAVTPRVRLLSPELKFAHAPHLAKPIECPVCHPAPDDGALPKGPIKPFCMDCHAKTRTDLNDCAVCHSEINKTVRPKFHGSRRIPHDAPQIWETLHGQESKNDPAFCALCHDKETSCEQCHRTNPPQNHTVAWRRKAHGLRATWDREKCSVCHEEDSCLKCHKSTEPSSHRAGWGRPLDRHCLNCHYPPERTNCTVCHETIEHHTAPPSPHDLGVFPAPCRRCHPGGIPYRAPHVLNNTVRCDVCH